MGEAHFLPVTFPYNQVLHLLQNFGKNVKFVEQIFFFDFAKKLEINFEASDDEGLTPIHTMCRNMTSLQGKKEYFENFLTLAKTEYGIEFNLKAISHDGKTPFEMLCQD